MVASTKYGAAETSERSPASSRLALALIAAATIVASAAVSTTGISLRGSKGVSLEEILCNNDYIYGCDGLDHGRKYCKWNGCIGGCGAFSALGYKLPYFGCYCTCETKLANGVSCIDDGDQHGCLSGYCANQNEFHNKGGDADKVVCNPAECEDDPSGEGCTN
mmetsp:Transcript_19944/g.61467  ORF Transcript_19944/g.61467 Transcript_19944/m.61467 type:complete len:163 (+) Transcript_19944:99-587(+)